jgi:MoaA/NifB/PqqE/SkfB family radical SAM enzyme
LQSGLDHLLLILQPENDLSWQALQSCLADDLFVAVHLTLLPANVSQVTDILERLAGLGVKAVSLSANDAKLSPALQEARHRAAHLQMELIWNLPVPYSNLHPIALESGPGEMVDGAGSAWIYVEPDGDVLPTQGLNRVLGNLLSDPWEKIWKAR